MTIYRSYRRQRNLLNDTTGMQTMGKHTDKRHGILTNMLEGKKEREREGKTNTLKKTWRDISTVVVRYRPYFHINFNKL